MALRNRIRQVAENLKDENDDITLATDIVQSRFLYALFSAMKRDLVILKGGLAMKALAGSVRSTKDIDMSCEPDANISTLNKHVHSAINNALRCGLLEDVTIREQDLSNGGVSPKWHINGRLAGSEAAVHIKIEVSKRDSLPEEAISRFEMKPCGKSDTDAYTIRTYSPMAMAASKVAALLDHNRNKPRDLYDLQLLIEMSVEPPVALLSALGKEKLENMIGRLWHKVASFTYNDFKTQVAPSLPQDIADSICESAWCDMQLNVVEHIESWLKASIEMAEHPIPRSELKQNFDTLKARAQEIAQESAFDNSNKPSHRP